MHRRDSFVQLVMAAVVASAGGTVLGQTCTPGWVPDFYASQLSRTVGGSLTVDLGSGPLCLMAGTGLHDHLTRLQPPFVWTGSGLEQFGPGVAGSVSAMVMFDPDGAGPEPESLIIGGQFMEMPGQPEVRGIARWNGTAFVPLGGFPTLNGLDGRITAMEVHNDGTGDKLIVAGRFNVIGSATTNNIASWNGTSWTAFGYGLELAAGETIHGLRSHTDSSGTFLYAAGSFGASGGSAETRGLARWDGLNWLPLGSGIPVGTGGAVGLYSVDLPTTGGPALIVTGTFSTIGGITSPRLAVWKDSAWQTMGTTTLTTTPSLTVIDFGSGPALYGQVGDNLTRWDGTSWVPIAQSSGSIIGTDQSPGSKRIMFKGTVDGVRFPEFGLFDGVSWTSYGEYGNAPVASPTCVAAGDLGQGPRFFANNVQSVHGEVLGGICMFDGSTWTQLAGPLGVVNGFNEMEVLDAGDGPHLYIAGSGTIGGVSRSGVLRWNGTDWEQVGPAIIGVSSSPSVPTQVRAFDLDGSGPRLYVSGVFRNSQGLVANVARLDGSAWTLMGPTLSSSQSDNALDFTFLDPDGPGGVEHELYVAGPLRGVRRAQGNSWQNTTFMLSNAHSLEVFDDGSGPHVYVSGQFLSTFVFRLDGMTPTMVGDVYVYTVPGSKLLVHDDGSGPALYALAKWILYVDPFTANIPSSLMKLTSTGWESLGYGPDPKDVVSHTFEGRPALFVASRSWVNDGTVVRSDGIVIHAGCNPSCNVDFNRDGDSGTDADIEAFFSCLAGNCCATCLTADFNGDGDSGTDADIESFFRVLAGGEC